MTMKRICDRCGNVIDDQEGTYHYREHGGEELDLCPICTEGFKTVFMQNVRIRPNIGDTEPTERITTYPESDI